MIIKDQVIPLFLEACPSYRKRWERYIEENYELGDKRLVYIELADFAKHVLNLYLEKQLGEFEAIFETTELLQTEGDKETNELAVVGFLEDLQNVILRSDRVDLVEFERYLGPVSLKSWRLLIDHWNGSQF